MLFQLSSFYVGLGQVVRLYQVISSYVGLGHVSSGYSRLFLVRTC